MGLVSHVQCFSVTRPEKTNLSLKFLIRQLLWKLTHIDTIHSLAPLFCLFKTNALSVASSHWPQHHSPQILLLHLMTIQDWQTCAKKIHNAKKVQTADPIPLKLSVNIYNGCALIDSRHSNSFWENTMSSPSIRHSFYSTRTIAIQRRKMSAYPGRG